MQFPDIGKETHNILFDAPKAIFLLIDFFIFTFRKIGLS
jgi:hypothetical protein